METFFHELGPPSAFGLVLNSSSASPVLYVKRKKFPLSVELTLLAGLEKALEAALTLLAGLEKVLESALTLLAGLEKALEAALTLLAGLEKGQVLK